MAPRSWITLSGAPNRPCKILTTNQAHQFTTPMCISTMEDSENWRRTARAAHDPLYWANVDLHGSRLWAVTGAHGAAAGLRQRALLRHRPPRLHQPASDRKSTRL